MYDKDLSWERGHASSVPAAEQSDEERSKL